MQQALAERSFPNPITGKTAFIEQVRPGQIRRGPIGGTLVPPSPDNTQIYLAGVQGDLQQACAAVGFRDGNTYPPLVPGAAWPPADSSPHSARWCSGRDCRLGNYVPGTGEPPRIARGLDGQRLPDEGWTEKSEALSPTVRYTPLLSP
jgi:hypothetical protein